MKQKKFNRPLGMVMGLFLTMVFFLPPGNSAGDETSGVLEIECNIADVPLTLCPKEYVQVREKKRFFGLFSKSENLCAQGAVKLGYTPVKPISLSAGDYILQFPEKYFVEGKETCEISVKTGQKTFYLLKLLSHNGDHGAAGAAGGGGAAGAGGK